MAIVFWTAVIVLAVAFILGSWATSHDVEPLEDESPTKLPLNDEQAENLLDRIADVLGDKAKSRKRDAKGRFIPPAAEGCDMTSDPNRRLDQIEDILAERN